MPEDRLAGSWPVRRTHHFDGPGHYGNWFLFAKTLI
jgi:hypothetical protein